MEFKIKDCRLVIKMGDITEENTGAIVNSANPSLLAGSGVSGAIHRKAGRELEKECLAIREEKFMNEPMPVGQAIMTKGYELNAPFVIHTAGPVWKNGIYGEETSLHKAYYHSLLLAEVKGIRSISFPSISTGIYRFPLTRAATIAVQTIVDFLIEREAVKEVRLVLFNENDYNVYKEVAKICTEYIAL